MSHKSCNLEEAWFIYSLLSIDPFGGTCGSCRPLRLDTGVLVGLVWTDPVRGFALRDRWCVSNEHKASYLKKCLSLSHKPAQDRAGCQTTAEHAGERILIKTNLLTTVILSVASFKNDTIVSENTPLDCYKKGHLLCSIKQNKSIFGTVFSKVSNKTERK